MASCSTSAGPVVGIDLGTTYSCVAVWRQGLNRCELIPNDQGNLFTPCCVAFTATGRLVGEAAVNQAALNPTNTIFEVERLIGRRFSDKSVQEDIKQLPFKVVASPEDQPIIEVHYKGMKQQLSATEISAMVLAKIEDIAEMHLGTTINKAVVTVPAYFNNSQRRATLDAGIIAGLKAMRIINKPCAAALAYGLNVNKKPRTVLVFDLGGDTFDLSLLSIGPTGAVWDRAKSVSEGKDSLLGGADLDSKMVEYSLGEFTRKHGKQIGLEQNHKAKRRLRTACETARRMLSTMTHTFIVVDSFHDGIDLWIPISRFQFEELNKDFFNECLKVMEMFLRDAKVDEQC